MSSYVGSEDSTCSGDTASTTSFSFDYPGDKVESNWNPDYVSYENSSMFHAIMSHEDTTGDRSWEIRIDTNGNIYSHFVKDMYGETFSPQNLPEAPWVDDVQQSVSVNQKLNQKNVLPKYCTGSTTDTCKKMFVHQAGAYQKDAESLSTTDEPFYSPSLASHCSGNTCMFASWGTQAHVATPFTSPIMYINKYTNCGDGKIEHTQMIHNFAPDEANPIDVDYDFFNVGWGGVRSCKLPHVLEPDPQDNSLDYEHPNDSDYTPLCHWSEDPEGRQEPIDISRTGGYTTFFGEGLTINRPPVSIPMPCSKPGGCTVETATTSMVDSCTDTQIVEGYKRIVLSSPPGGPQCSRRPGTWNGYITLSCNLLDEAVFGKTVRTLCVLFGQYFEMFEHMCPNFLLSCISSSIYTTQ